MLFRLVLALPHLVWLTLFGWRRSRSPSSCGSPCSSSDVLPGRCTASSRRTSATRPPHRVPLARGVPVSELHGVRVLPGRRRDRPAHAPGQARRRLPALPRPPRAAALVDPRRVGRPRWLVWRRALAAPAASPSSSACSDGSPRSYVGGCRVACATPRRTRSATAPRPPPTRCSSPTAIRSRPRDASSRHPSCRRIPLRSTSGTTSRRPRLLVAFRFLLSSRTSSG